MKDAIFWSEKIKKRKISLAEYCQSIDEKMKEINPQINSLINWNLDQLLADCQNKPLNQEVPFFGIPIPLKMLGQEKKGWPATAGSKLFVNQIANQTSNFVNRLESLGFLAAGQTNTPEFGFKNITDAEIYGPARNPWDLAFSPGGSSGGAAAAVASGLFPLAAASDGGGSIRIPASFSGLIGLKPTRGSIPTGPGSWRSWQGASIDFALTVSMRDTESLFYHLRGNAKAAPYHPPKDTWEQQQINSSLKIAFLTKSPVSLSVSEEAKTAVKQAVHFLQESGHQVEEIHYPLDGIELMRSYYLMNGAETSAMFAGIKSQLKRELSIKDMELMTWGIYQYGEKISAKNYIQALNKWDYAAAKMEELFNSYDLLLTPTTAFSAPKIDQELQSDQIREELKQAEIFSEKELADLIYRMFEKSLQLSPFTQLANLTGQPAISLPTHLTKAGLPLGIQFMASKGREDLLFFMGRKFELAQHFRLPVSYR